jgi:hypothetical protein
MVNQIQGRMSIPYDSGRKTKWSASVAEAMGKPLHLGLGIVDQLIEDSLEG